MKSLLVLRRLQTVAGLNGGVLKTLDYFSYARESGLVEVRLLLIPSRPWDPQLEGYVRPDEVVTDPCNPSLILLNREWDEADRMGLTAGPLIIHMVSHSAYGQAGTPERELIGRHATHIISSKELGDRIKTYEHARGTIETIEAAVSMPVSPRAWEARSYDVTIAGRKNPLMANAIYELLRGANLSVQLLTAYHPRSTYLDLVSRGRVLLALPYTFGETQFLTALEGMLLDMGLVLPETFGTGSYCVNGVSCVTTAYEPRALADQAIQLLGDPTKLQRLRNRARQITSHLTIQNERSRFLALFEKLVGEAPEAA
jgi:hypothetical protein